METNDLPRVPGAPSLIIYYGTEMPKRELTRKLRNTTVVLQPYHALCQSGEFAEYFPQARRFVYFNPTATDSGTLADRTSNIAVLGHDDFWNLERIDLRKGSARKFAIEQGRKALSFPGTDGLFVDDLDRWDHPDKRRHAVTVLRAITAARVQPSAWFLNRGFGFWHRMPNLSAVLLENLTPYQVDRMNALEISWLTTVALQPLRCLHDRGVAIFSLTYDPVAVRWQPIGTAARVLAALTSEPILSTLHFDRWPKNLIGEISHRDHY
jgi:hypothetical protein